MMRYSVPASRKHLLLALLLLPLLADALPAQRKRMPVTPQPIDPGTAVVYDAVPLNAPVAQGGRRLNAAGESDTLQSERGVPVGWLNGLGAGLEESAMIAPNGPCTVDEIYIFLGGSGSRKDTIWVVGDPSEGALPPTSFVWSYNALVAPFVVNFTGQGWVRLDLRSANLHLGGYDRFFVQHRVQNTGGGPYFVCDSVSPSQPYTSFIYDPTQNNNLGFPGVYSLFGGHYVVHAVVRYDNRAPGGGSAAPPVATLVDQTAAAGFRLPNGDTIRSARVSVADWNSDGWDDIAVGNLFFQNRKDGTFQPVDTRIEATATVWGDIDNDGDLDCYAVNGGASDRVYRNNNDGTFTDITASTGITNPAPTVTPMWIDYDRDGRLDLFIANGRTEVSGNETYYPDKLWHNNGNGTWSDVSATAGVSEDPARDCWAATAGDYNSDGLIDLFVATYRLAPDALYRNDGNGTFTDVGASTGVQGVPTADTSYYGHGAGADWGDYDNDGDFDLAVGNLGHPDWRGQVSNPSLIWRNDGAPSYNFTEVHKDLGLKFFEMNFGIMWLDLDLDGNLDLWHCQYAYQAAGVQGEPRRRSRVYRNLGPAANWKLDDQTWQLGSDIHGAWTAARLDYDNDGDLDIIAASPTEGIKLFRNDIPHAGHWLELRLSGDTTAGVSRDAYGTRVTVYTGGKSYTRALWAGGEGTTATQHSSKLHFGVGASTAIDSIVLNYPTGARQVLRSQPVDTILAVPYAQEPVGVREREMPASGWKLGQPSVDRTGLLRIPLSGEQIPSSVVVRLTDIAGRTLWEQEVEVRSGVASYMLGASMPAGVYALRASAHGQSDEGTIRIVR